MWTFISRRNTRFFQLVKQSPIANIERTSSTATVPLVRLQDLGNHLTLDIANRRAPDGFQGNGPVQRDFGQREIDFRWTKFAEYRVFGTENHIPLEQIFQFANIP